MIRTWIFGALAAAFFASAARAQDELNDHLEKATKDAVRKVAPSVVQIVTQGGADAIVTGSQGQIFRKALGPTTGVIVDADGYVISSAFNFLNDPKNIFVTVPGQKEPLPAKKVATDRSRMLTLLKVDAKGLLVPTAAPKAEIREGAWAIALGRTLESKSDPLPSVSLGIISALGRVWGKAIQTDAKVSPINYGGPLVDIQGRVQGILIPASPKEEGETAGYEWYDSGIGFAIPMEDVLAAVTRLKEGKDLQRGLLGISLKTQDIYGSEPVIGAIKPDSAAAKAGLKPGDVIVEIEGKPVVRMAQIQHILGPRYEGDKISLKYRRGAEVKALANLELVGQVQVAAAPFLGILAMRDDPKLGVEVRHVFTGSPAEKAGIKAGDRILKYGPADGDLSAFQGDRPGRQELLDWLSTLSPKTEVKLEVARKEGGKSDTVSLALATLPGSLSGEETAVIDKLPQPASAKKALVKLEKQPGKDIEVKKIDDLKKSDEVKKGDPGEKVEKKAETKKAKVETGLLKKTTADGEHRYWLFVHEDYDPNVAHAVVVWLHPPGKNKEADFENLTDLWADFCRDNHIVMVLPVSENDSGWVPSEADFVTAALREVLAGPYTLDRQRVIAHGMGVGGQLAIYLGFNQRDLIHGVATVGSVVTGVKDNTPRDRLSFYLAVGSLDPLLKSVAESRTKLLDKHYPVLYREIVNRGREYLEEGQLRELVRWIDALDKL